MKFYIASSFRNIENVRKAAEQLKRHGHVQTYDWTVHSSITSISQLRDIGREEVNGIKAADVVVIMIPAGKGSHIELGMAIGLQKKIYLYASSDEINERSATTTFYHIEEVEQCIGP